MWFKNATLFRLKPDFEPSFESLSEAFSKAMYTPGLSNQDVTLGFTPPCEHSPLVLYATPNQQYLGCVRHEKKLLPAQVINQFVKERAQQLEEQQGYKPGRKQMKELKENVIDELRPRAFSMSSDTYFWIDPKNKWFVVDGSVSKADMVVGLIAKALGDVPFQLLDLARSPIAAMTEWLLDEDSTPGNFTIDQEAELKNPDESKATIKYANQTPEHDDVVKHTLSGKVVTKLAMTWDSRISFVLSDKMEVKRIKPLDIFKNEEGDAETAEDLFATDAVLMTSELSRLFTDLVALVGEAEGDGEAADKAA